MRGRKSRIAVTLATVALSVGVAAAPASAAPQNGLVNVNVSGNTVQVPIGVAANICDVNVAVIAEVTDDQAVCNADADANSVFDNNTPGGGGGGAGGIFIPIDIDLGSVVPLG